MILWKFYGGNSSQIFTGDVREIFDGIRFAHIIKKLILMRTARYFEYKHSMVIARYSVRDESPTTASASLSL